MVFNDGFMQPSLWWTMPEPVAEVSFGKVIEWIVWDFPAGRVLPEGNC